MRPYSIGCRILARLNQEARRREMLRLARDLDAHILRDIGLHRGDVRERAAQRG